MKNKSDLRRDVVYSDGFHVGIELELKAPCEGGGRHDDDACHDSQRSMYEDESDSDILRNYFSVPRGEASRLADYFDRERWIDDVMQDWSCDGDCDYQGTSGSSVRQDLQNGLKHLTGNTSFKVVEDSSIDTDGDECDAEVCWNYFASKETIKDNEKILSYLDSQDCKFDTSCGLHINLNNYLNVPKAEIPVQAFDFLFRFVAPSRSNNEFCNRKALSSSQKYSMIYHQDDRLEFRFFSPTLNPEKLNAYVALANTIYKRLAGKACKLPKSAAEFLINKMMTHGHTELAAREAVDLVNQIESVETFKQKEAVKAHELAMKELEEIRASNALQVSPSTENFNYTQWAQAIAMPRTGIRYEWNEQAGEVVAESAEVLF